MMCPKKRSGGMTTIVVCIFMTFLFPMVVVADWNYHPSSSRALSAFVTQSSSSSSSSSLLLLATRLSSTFVVSPSSRVIHHYPYIHSPHKLTSSSTSSLLRLASREEEPEKEVWKEKGETLIRNAAIEAGADPTNLKLSWKPGKLIITVTGNTMLGKGKLNDDDDEDDVVEYDDDDDDDDDDDMPIMEEEDDSVEEEVEEEEEKLKDGQIDIVAVTRAINVALSDDDEVGFKIAETHEIEVTTPGASDILEGAVMFEAYKGFPVIVETTQLKKNGKPKILEGNLIEKNENEVRINVKGRISKVKNEFLVCVRLPKAKKETKKRK